MFRLSTLALLACSTPVLAQEINVYSHRQPELIQPLVDAFTAETGIAVNVAFVDKGMAERLQAEGDRSPADLVLTVDIARLKRLSDIGFNRISFGVQDFDPQVQKAVHRVQSTESIFALVEASRSLRFQSVNIDLIYGLPMQTPESFERSLDDVRDADRLV